MQIVYMPYTFLPLKTDPIITPTSVLDVESDSFRQELIYNGRDDNEVRFLYRELTEDLLRPAFTQEVQYDLEQSDVIGFKGGLPENHQSNPPLPRNREPVYAPGFLVPANHSFDVRFAPDSGRWDGRVLRGS